MPILNHNDLKKVEEYQNFVRTSPFANATQDLGWEKVKEGWIGEQVYLEEDGKIIAAMSLIIRRAFAGFSLMYAPRAPICDFSDTQLVKRLLDEAKPLAKKYRAFVLRFDPELPRLPQLEEEYLRDAIAKGAGVYLAQSLYEGVDCPQRGHRTLVPQRGGPQKVF